MITIFVDRGGGFKVGDEIQIDSERYAIREIIAHDYEPDSEAWRIECL